MHAKDCSCGTVRPDGVVVMDDACLHLRAVVTIGLNSNSRMKAFEEYLRGERTTKGFLVEMRSSEPGKWKVTEKDAI